jgi:hypothetical protein
MNSEALKIFVEQDFRSYHVNIWVIETKGMDEFNIHYDGEFLERTKIDRSIPDNINKPFLSLDKSFSDVLFKTIAEYNSEAGIKTKSDHNIEGQLTAKSEHLSDMQMIVKKLLKIN